MEKVKLSNKNDISPIDAVVFIFDDTNKFVAYLHELVEDLILPSGGKLIWYSSQNAPVELVSDAEYSLCDAFRDLYIGFKMAFRGEMEYVPIHPQGIGYEWNQLLAKDPDTCIDRKNQLRKHKIWCAPRGPKTWLYTQHGQFILEITPFYAWTEETIAAEEDDTLEAFRERMRDYKPLAKFIMSQEVAERWYAQAKELVSIIYKNYERDSGHHVDIETEI